MDCKRENYLAVSLITMEYEHIEATGPDFVTRAAEWLADRIQRAIEERNECILGLSGGSTPGPVYEALGKNTDIDWSKVYVFLVDERHVSADDKESNQYLLRNTLLKYAGIPEENLCFPLTNLEITECVADYMVRLTHLFIENPADLVVLGMGDDGHTASLFPPVPEIAFGEVLVLHTTTDRFAIRDRISVSPLVIMASKAQLLLLKGEKKVRVFEEMLASNIDPARWPLQVAFATEKVTAIVDPS